jgi:carbon storage regulator CsrA
MLVLTRNLHGRIVLPSVGVTIEVLDVRSRRGNPSVKLGFCAPSNVPIHREELWVEILQEGSGGLPLPCSPERKVKE